MNIGLDFDDVIAHSHALKPGIAKALYEIGIPEKFFYKEFVVGRKILTDEQYITVVRKVYNERHNIDPVPGAIQGIKSLLKTGHSVCIVTNRSDEHNNLIIAKEWLANHALDLPITGLVYGSSKASACIGMDLFVDDDPAKLQDLVGVVPRLLFFCWPHNIHKKEPKGAIRVFSWKEVCFHVDRISKEECTQ